MQMKGKNYIYLHSEMTKKKSLYVSNKEILTKSSEDIELSKFTVLTNFPKKSEQFYFNLMSDGFEALIGALYLEFGFIKIGENNYDVVGKLIHKHLLGILTDELEKKSEPIKSRLQHLTQTKMFGKLPSYNEIAKYGDIFISCCLIDNILISLGEGLTKKESENSAAEKAIKIFSFNEDFNDEKSLEIVLERLLEKLKLELLSTPSILKEKLEIKNKEIVDYILSQISNNTIQNKQMEHKESPNKKLEISPNKKKIEEIEIIDDDIEYIPQKKQKPSKKKEDDDCIVIE